MKNINISIKVQNEDYENQRTLQHWLKEWEYFIEAQSEFKGDWIEMRSLSIPLEALLELPEHLLVEIERDLH